MEILVLSINHGEQLVPVGDEDTIPTLVEKTEQLRTVVRQVIASRKVELVCEESDPRHVSIAQEEAFKHSPRIPWKNINMTSQERLEAGIWKAMLDRPYDFGPNNPVRIDYRIPEDEVREEYFKTEILSTAKGTGATSILVLCGDAHTEPLKTKLESAGHHVETNHDLTPEKRWK